MSLSAISSSSSSYPNTIQNNFKQRADDLKALKTALQSGDISAAQSAFATFKQDLTGAQQPSNTSQATQDMQTLASALGSGDIASAQKAFGAFQADLQSAHKAHHHHHKLAATNDAQAQIQSTDSTHANSVIGSILNQQA